jgi:hypothetical protein
MAIRVLTFDPLNRSDVEKFEQDLDFYLNDGWDVLTTIAGNRSGVAWGGASARISKVKSPEYKDYVVFVLRNVGSTQDEMEPAEVVKRTQ